METCYIFGAGCGLPQKLTPLKGDLVIAADAGLRSLEKLNISPDIIIGDFDSLCRVPDGKEVITFPKKKDDTDTLLAVKKGFEKGYKSFKIYGGTGGRADHTFANIQTLLYISERGGQGFLYGDNFTASVITNGEISFDGQSGNISVFSLSDKSEGVNIKGLLYEAESLTLKNSFPLGVSNEFINKKAHISVEKGSLLIIF